MMVMVKTATTILVLILINLKVSLAFKKCHLVPTEFSQIRGRNNDKYVIEIDGHPDGYFPGETYTITLKINPFIPGRISRFRDFMLTVEPKDLTDSRENLDVGRFQLIDRALTKFSERCKNTVIETNSVPKKDIIVNWKAPPPGTGCLNIVAMVKVSSRRWFAEDGKLVKPLCELQEENENSQAGPLDKCCACDEAKYEMAFKGMWSRNTHPNNFPDDLFLTKFSELVGASHRKDHSFWGYNQMASEGMKALAESGDTKVLEDELKQNIGNVRTIIKARELAHPHLTGTTYTVFRVDRINHLVSVVSKITPSPDWIVGVSNLELCLKDCSWVEQKILNLYPYDVGTAEGSDYISPSVRTDPQQPIKRIMQDVIDDPQSPFYSEDGEPIKPFARIYLTRQKLYEKSCPSDDDDNVPEEDEVKDPLCPTTDWSEWSSCTKCSTSKTRSLIFSGNSTVCSHINLKKTKKCDECDNGEECATTEWSEWSSCSTNCGKGTKTQDREFVNPDNKESCIQKGIEYQRNEQCEGDECDNDTPRRDCPDTITWSDWTPCNVTCGIGFKERVKVEENEEGGHNDEKGNEDSCKKEIVQCEKPHCEEGHETTENSETGGGGGGGGGDGDGNGNGNGNEPSSESQIISTSPVGRVIDCKVSKWSKWTECDAKPCEKGYMQRNRTIIRHPSNGGAPCPSKLMKRKRCNGPCDSKKHNKQGRYYSKGSRYGKEQIEGVPIDCKQSNWSSWSPCSKNCGPEAIRVRTRTTLVQPNEWGKQCEGNVEEQNCHLPNAC